MARTNLTRRQFLESVGAGASVLATSSCGSEPPKIDFLHGVASGDPLQDRVILWTRATPIHPDTMAGAELLYEVAEDPAFERIAAQGTVPASPERDFTVKVDVAGLAPATRYFYRFGHGEVTSPVGRARTLPEGDTGLYRIAVVSCSSFQHGFFNVYKELATRLDIDIVLHLGDYFYEYDIDSYFTQEAKDKGRLIQPETELIGLRDYRERYAFYRSDPDLQAVHAAHPFIAVWDDHEIADNAYKDGAVNHNEGEGDWAKRKAAAIKAYMEWMPVRENAEDPARIYRSFRIGNFADLIMLDTRNEARDRQLNYADDLIYRDLPFDFSDAENPVAVSEQDALALPEGAVRRLTVPFDVRVSPPEPVADYAILRELDPNDLPDGFAYLPDGARFKDEKINAAGREVLGAAQEEWLATQLEASVEAGRTWQIIGQQILVGDRLIPDIRDKIIDGADGSLTARQLALIDMLHGDNLPLNLDEWDGYGEARNRFLETLSEAAANPVILTGDTHNCWAYELTVPGTGQPAAVEFGTASVTSPGLEAIFPVDPTELVLALQDKSSELKYAQVGRRGYLLLDLAGQAATASWHLVNTVLDRSYTVQVAKTMRVTAGERKLEDLG